MKKIKKLFFVKTLDNWNIIPPPPLYSLGKLKKIKQIKYKTIIEIIFFFEILMFFEIINKNGKRWKKKIVDIRTTLFVMLIFSKKVILATS